MANEVIAEANRKGSFDSQDSALRFLLDNLSYEVPEGFAAASGGGPAHWRSLARHVFARELQRKAELLADPELSRRFQRIVFLKAIDVAWIEQVDFLEQLKTVVQDRNLAQHRVEYEYRREAHFAFAEMKHRVRRDIVRLLCLSRIEQGADGGLIIQFA